jgi:hypothetical protein
MSKSLVESVKILKDKISISALQGTDYKALLAELGLSLKLGLYVAKNVLIGDGYIFTVNAVATDLSNFDGSSSSKLHCFAPIHDVWEAFRFESSAEIPLPNTPVYRIYEALAKSGNAGIIGTELNSLKPGTFVDRCVALGTLVKRLVISSPEKNFPNRRKLPNKSVTILHLRRFAPHYNPESEGNLFSGSDDKREEGYEFFYHLMKANNINSMPAGDLGKILGIPMRSMQVQKFVLLFTFFMALLFSSFTVHPSASSSLRESRRHRHGSLLRGHLPAHLVEFWWAVLCKTRLVRGHHATKSQISSEYSKQHRL